eukprot:759847-Hanusia_phi.AAC.1
MGRVKRSRWNFQDSGSALSVGRGNDEDRPFFSGGDRCHGRLAIIRPLVDICRLLFRDSSEAVPGTARLPGHEET